MKRAVLVNCSAGVSDDKDDRLSRVREACVAAGLDADVITCAPAQLTARARALAAEGFEVVVAAGGDGTISAIASGLSGTPTALAVLPLGTRNHFARDLGMPLELADAAAAIAAGEVRRIDLGEVNGRPFLNNSSIGMYPEIVMDRVAEQKAKNRSKSVAMVIAAARVLKRFPLLSVRIGLDGGPRMLRAKTPFVFVGNNEYSTNALSVGSRERLDVGELGLYTVRCRGRLHLFWVVMRALLQRLDRIRDFTHAKVEQATIDLHGRFVTVALDGEVERMKTPLVYKIRKGALAVIAPSQVTRVEAVPLLQREVVA